MTKLPGKPILPITPTQDEDGTPTTCTACGRVAMGIGVGFKHRKDDEPRYLCKGCITAVSDLSKFDRLSVFELAALDAGVDAVGEYLETIGIYDLTLMDELNRRMIVKSAWEGCIRGVREALKEPPF